MNSDDLVFDREVSKIYQKIIQSKNQTHNTTICSSVCGGLIRYYFENFIKGLDCNIGTSSYCYSTTTLVEPWAPFLNLKLTCGQGITSPFVECDPRVVIKIVRCTFNLYYSFSTSLT